LEAFNVNPLLYVVVDIRLDRLVEEAIPLTTEVKVLPLKLSPLEFTAVVVEVTPLTEEVIVLPLLFTELLLITDDVAVTPLMVVVSVLPDKT
jgi:hypothetical protein